MPKDLRSPYEIAYHRAFPGARMTHAQIVDEFRRVTGSTSRRMMRKLLKKGRDYAIRKLCEAHEIYP